MTDLFFYDDEFKLVEQMGRFVSLNITKKYCGYGTVEIHFSENEHRVIEMLENNPFLMLATPEVQAVITGWRLGEDIAVFGKTLEWLLTKRAVSPFSDLQNTPEEIARFVAEEALGDFAVLAEPLGIGEVIDYSSQRVQTAFDVVQSVLQPVGLGFSLALDIDAKQFVFSVYTGKNNSLLLSVSNKTACEMKYTKDIQEMADGCGWYERRMTYMGQWSASANSPKLSNNDLENAFSFYEITTEDTRFGLKCVKGEYLYCDSRDGVWKTSAERPATAWDYFDSSEKIGAARWELILSGVKTPEEAQSEILAHCAEEEIETALRGVNYGIDYNLGDTVRVQTEFGAFRRSERKRVCEVEIFYDVDACGTKPVLKSLEG